MRARITSMSLKNKLIWGFFILGTIPSLVLGFIIYKEMLDIVQSIFPMLGENEVIQVHLKLEHIHTRYIKMSLTIITLSICFSVGVSHNFIEGIRKLIKYFERVQAGDFDFDIEVENTDEISILTQSFKEMKGKLSKLIDRTYKLEISEKDAQLKALQAQISPHFLYNALDMVNWSLIESGDMEMSHIVIALSDILRYSIDDTKKKVKVREEMQQIQNYLLIQKSRFEERLNYKIDVQLEVLEESIPKLLLQPIVENAVIHGIENRQRKGVVTITSSYDDRYLIFEVQDNGLGIQPERLEKLRQRIAVEDKMVDSDQKVHIGLANVNQRIQLSYGKDSSIEIDSVIDEGTTIRLILERGNT
ncbi:MAG: sensor histidine kinase [Cellulosilyticaceae bacterium]